MTLEEKLNVVAGLGPLTITQNKQKKWRVFLKIVVGHSTVNIPSPPKETLAEAIESVHSQSRGLAIAISKAIDE